MSEYVRICPTCGSENAPDVLRCACGKLLVGIDLQVRPEAAQAKQEPAPESAAKATLFCPFDDCAQENPPGSTHCLYCNRPLLDDLALTSPGLLRLPDRLAERYRIVRVFPASGAEADLLLVEPLQGGEPLMAKIYRRGVFPKTAVQERIRQVDVRYRVHFIETGTAGGHAYELMEYCPLGTLRDRMPRGPLEGEALQMVVRELAAGLAALHQAGLVHRDLKPDNVLIRDDAPLQLVLTDFGIASVLDTTQRFTGTARTLHYAAPESLSGIIDSKTDYWALGMLLLELVLGKHPFAGLSDAVILHHLTTQPMDLSAVASRPVRKLLAGLLLRDPVKRWGSLEIFRWLACDPTLPEPQEENGNVFATPYRLGKEICRNPEHLAVALARHWKAGVADLDNGQLLRWFREEVKDHDTVRLLLEMRHERALHVDVQLLRLILHLAPGVPPMWRGESIELRGILERANLALKGDRDAESWLDALYQHKVLEAYAAAGNAEIGEIVACWNQACDLFEATWQKQTEFLQRKKAPRQPGEVVDFDAAMFGSGGLRRPPLSGLHARLLAFAYDEFWEKRFRQHVEAELLPLRLHCPWLEELGDPASMNAAELLVLESLLPEARKEAHRLKTLREAQSEEAQREIDLLEIEAVGAIETLKLRAQTQSLGASRCDDIADALERYFNVVAALRKEAGKVRPDVLERALKLEPAALRVSPLLDLLREKQAITRGWLSIPVLVLFLLVMLILPRIVGDWLLYTMLVLASVIVLWRLLPEHFLKKSLREALDRIVQT